MVYMRITRFPELEYQTHEAINTLCANLSFTGGDLKTLLITSCQPQDGKSFISMNLMRSMARLGLRVLLIDADIRASALKATYGIEMIATQGSTERYEGLSGYLVGRCDADDILAQTSIDGAYMILAGKMVMNSLPLFNTNKMPELINRFSNHFDVILVDVPPVGTLIDAAQIATYCDGAVMVVRSEKTRAGDLTKAVDQLKKANCPLVGYVLNQMNEKGAAKKYSYYKYSTKTAESEAVARRRRKQP